MSELFLVLFFLFVLSLTVQAVYNIQTSLYGWFNERVFEKRSKVLHPQRLRSFTVLIPAYHEELVIANTIHKIASARYPKELVQILVLCRSGDEATIAEANRSIAENRIQNASVLIYEGDVPGKPAQLNQGLKYAKNELLVIFDAEDDVSLDLFSSANALYDAYGMDVLQMGVQLMDHDSSWYSTHNVLEYFFHFRSRMYYFAQESVVPLGGNTCFFKTRDLVDAGGWDEWCLTEDAEVGLRLSSQGKTFDVFYAANQVTREETPHSLQAFIKQRTRWDQGFLQTIQRGYWKKLPTRKQRILAFYILTLPFFQAAVFLTTPFLIWLAFNIKMPILLSLASFIPLGLLLFLLVIQLLGLREFGKDQMRHIKLRTYLLMIVTFIPFQFVLSYAAVRATKRMLLKSQGWEKTFHSGVHRNLSTESGVL